MENSVTHIVLDRPLTWQEIKAVAHGARLSLGSAAKERIMQSRKIVDAIVSRNIRAYGVNTGVGALSDQIVPQHLQRALSRNLLMSHACGTGDWLSDIETRAIIAAAINNYAHGYSGIRLEVVEALLDLLEHNVMPLVPARGSVGYLTHMAHIGLVLIGEGQARVAGNVLTGAAAQSHMGKAALVLEAKEGLSLVNGTPCATGLAALALSKIENLLQWADRTGAMSFEALGGQIAAFDVFSLALRKSDGLQLSGAHIRALLEGSGLIAEAQGKRTQDALSLRAMPHVHGAARDMFGFAADAVNRELASVTDNPLIGGTAEAPQVFSEAHAVGASLGLALDAVAIAIAEVAAMAERRIGRLVNPALSGLPAFLAQEGGVFSCFMIAQYSAASLVAENRRLANPASLDGGITSAQQEDHLAHATPAALKLLQICANTETIVAIEYMAAAQALELQSGAAPMAKRTAALVQLLRKKVAPYADDTPLSAEIEKARAVILE